MANINITKGNDVRLKATLMRDGEKFPVELSEEVRAEVVSRIGGRTFCACEMADEGMVLVDVPGSLLPGGYIVAVYGVLDGSKWRSACRGLFITTVTETEGTMESSLTKKAESIVSDGDAYDITMEVQMYKADVPGAIAAHNQDKTAHADIRELIPTLQSCVNRVAVKQETIADDEILLCKSNIIYEVSYDGVIMVELDTPIADIKNEYCIKFDVGSTVPTLTLPDDIVWSETLALEANTHYVILISYENGRFYGDWKSYPLT